MIAADDLRFFLEVARSGRLTAAGKALKVDHTTVGRRIAGLERQIGGRLFDRAPQGWTLTDRGEILLEYAEAVESTLLAASEALSSGGGRLSGTLRISTPDGFGAYVLAPNLGDLCSHQPELDVEIVTATRSDVVGLREFDVAVTLERPSPRLLEVTELADYDLGLYASEEYFSSRPAPKTVLDLYAHTLISYVDVLLDVPALRVWEEVLPGHRAQIQTNNISGQYEAAVAGLGIAVLPLYLAEKDHRLIRILGGDVVVTRRYWLAVPRDLYKLRRIRTAVEMLRSIVRESPYLTTRFLPR